MSHPQFRGSLCSASLAVVAAVALSIACATRVVASPEDEVARLNRVRANLFEELVKTRAEVATARSELEAAVKARDAAEAEVTRLRQEAASGLSAVGSGILLAPLIWTEEAAGGCTLRSHRSGGVGPVTNAVAAAGACRSRQTVSAAHSSSVPSARTRSRSRRNSADAVPRAPAV